MYIYEIPDIVIVPLDIFNDLSGWKSDKDLQCFFTVYYLVHTSLVQIKHLTGAGRRDLLVHLEGRFVQVVAVSC